MHGISAPLVFARDEIRYCGFPAPPPNPSSPPTTAPARVASVVGGEEGLGGGARPKDAKQLLEQAQKTGGGAVRPAHQQTASIRSRVMPPGTTVTGTGRRWPILVTR